MKKYLSVIFVLLLFLSYAQDKKCNCCTETHQQFDFWLGDWETFTPKGDLAGANTIDKIQDNCVLRENWTSAKGNYTGTSYNFYNYKRKQWEQLWVDNQGQMLYLKGKREEHQMILMSDATTNANGTTVFNRVTWTQNTDGAVRQLWETSSDKKQWKTVFDSLYKKKNKAE